MNLRLFTKRGLHLNTCRTNREFLFLIAHIRDDFKNDDIDTRPKILALFDHMLDREYG